METTTSFDLIHAIKQWRANLAYSPAFRNENLNELESHLRDSIATLQTRGLSGQEAFCIAAHRLGGCELLGQEFGKVNGGEVWRTRSLWMLASMLVFVVGADLAGAVSSALVFFGSLVGTNGFSLGWFGVAGKCAVFVFVLWLFRSAAAGGLDRISGSIHRVFRHPTLTIGIIITALALKCAASGFTAVSAQRLPPITLSQAYMITSFGNVVGQFLMLVFLIVYLTRFFLQRRTSGGIGAILLVMIIPLAIHETVAQAQTQPPAAGKSNQAEKQSRSTLDQAMKLWRVGKKAEATEKFMAVDMSQRPLFPTGSVLNYSEKQFVALPQAVRDKLSKEMLADIQVIKEICAHVKEASKSAASGGDNAKAEKGLAQLKKCGEALDQPDSLALLQMVGKGLKKTAAAQSSTPKN
jgi:hypothetical protein